MLFPYLGAVLRPLCWLLLLTFAPSCATVITPDRVRAADAPSIQKQRAVEQWQAAVELVNGFLAEQPPEELPWFRLDLTDQGMLLITEEGVQRFEVACTSWGSLVVMAGYTAQERSWGFVVGPEDGDGDPLLENSFFWGWLGMRGAGSMGGLILHEAVHTLQPSGTVGFWRGLRYYWLAIWHGGGDEHPDEKLAYAIERRFLDWASTRR